MDDIVNKITGDVKLRAKRASKPIIVNISNRHIHLCKDDMEKLFGSGYTLNKIKDLMQPGEHACKETVSISGKKGEIKNVRVLGPLRKVTQIEISKTDTFALGVNAPLRVSGDVSGSAPLTIAGPSGKVELKEGCIIARRHVHMTPSDAAFYEVKDGDTVRVKFEGARGLIFDNVVARVRPDMSLEFHVDMDEANAAGITNGSTVVLL